MEPYLSCLDTRRIFPSRLNASLHLAHFLLVRVARQELLAQRTELCGIDSTCARNANVDEGFLDRCVC